MDHPHRRQVLVAGATGIGLVAVGAGALYVTNGRGASRFEAESAATRHVDPRGDPRRQLVHYATMAANSHNTQPWRFSVSDTSIMIMPDFARRLAAVDPDNHHLFVSLGCAAENIVQAAPAHGFKAVPIFDTAAGKIRIALEKTTVLDANLVPAIALRQSTRVDYDGKQLPQDQVRALEAVGNGPGVQMQLFTEPDKREAILSYLVTANTAQMADKAFLRELKQWLRFSYADADVTRDGLFSKCSGNPVMPRWVALAVFPLVFTAASENSRYQRQLRSSAGIAVFASDKNEPAAWVETGRCCQRFALQATALGIRTAYINQPVEVPAVRGQFAAWLNIGQRRPDIVMRFGNGPLLPQSLRRPLAEVIVDG